MNTTEYYSLKISKKSLLHNSYWLLSLELPSNLQPFFKFQAGQSLPLRLLIDGEWQQRYFSLCNPPNATQQLELMIKIDHNSLFLSNLHSYLQHNNQLLIGAAMGNFCLSTKPNEQRHLLAICAGIGIAPILSHIAHHLSQEPGSHFCLCYGLAKPELNVAQESIEALQKKFGERLQVHYFYSQHPSSLFYQGRLDAKKLKLIANQLLDWDEVDALLLCGPQSMMQDLANQALQMGMPAQHIYYESFVANSSLALIQQSQIAYLEDIDLHYTYQQKDYQLRLSNNQLSIAQQLINAKLPVPYSCKSGVCGTCQCQVIEGEVKITDNEFLTDTEIQKGQTLACTAYAIQPYLKLDFDHI